MKTLLLGLFPTGLKVNLPNKPGINKPTIVFGASTLALVIGLGVAFNTAGGGVWASFPLDDAWIHMVYGRAVAETGWPIYSDRIEAGFTSPLWMTILAFWHLIWPVAGPPVLPIKLTGWFLTAACAWVLMAALGRARSGGKPLPVLVVFGIPLWFILDRHMAFAMGSGMETSLASLLLLLTGYAMTLRRHTWVGIVFAGAVLARPEALALLPLLILPLWFDPTTKRPVAICKLFGPTLFAVAGWVVFCFMANGHPLPNTAYNKVSDLGGAIAMLPTVLIDIVGPWSPVAWGLGLPLLLFGLVGMVRRDASDDKPDPGALFLVLAPFVLLLAVSLTRVVRDPQAFYWTRYFVPVLPLLFYPLALGTGMIAGRGKGYRWAVLAGGGVLIMLNLIGLPESRVRYADNCHDIDALNVTVGKLINNLTQPDAVLGTNDAGAIRYFGKRRTIDLVGLNNWEYLFDKTRMEAFRRERFTHFALSRGVFDPLKKRNMRLLHRAEVRDNSLFDLSPYWMDLYEVIDPDLIRGE